MSFVDLSAHELVFEWLNQRFEARGEGGAVRLGLFRAVFLPEMQEFHERFPRVEIQAQQFWALDFDGLKNENIPCCQELEGKFDLIVIVPSHQRVESLALVARGTSMLNQGGFLVVCCSNHLGAKGYQKFLSTAFDSIEVISKSKCRLMVVDPESLQHREVLEEWRKGLEPIQIEGTSLRSIPGLFGWNQMDHGSTLLVEKIPFPLVGSGLDLGCGYGYLSYEILKRSPQLSHLTLLDADVRAIDCARLNLSEFGFCHREYLWEEISTFYSETSYDWIVMNPPFHHEKNTEVDLGVAFIQKAAAYLKKEGKLFMVCNQSLPYEKVISKYFSCYHKVEEGHGYKVIFAER